MTAANRAIGTLPAEDENPAFKLPARPRVLTNVIAVRVEPALYDRIEAAAQREGRTLSGWVRRAALERLDGPPNTTGC